MEADEHGHEERRSGRGAARSSGPLGAERRGSKLETGTRARNPQRPTEQERALKGLSSGYMLLSSQTASLRGRSGVKTRVRDCY